MFVQNADLPGITASNISLSGLDLSGINLTNSILTNVDLSNATFTSAVLKNTRFMNCNMQGVTISSSNLQNATISGSDLSSSSISNSNLMLLNIIDVEANYALFDTNTMTFADFLGLEGTHFEMTGGEGEGMTIGNGVFSSSEFSNIDLSNADIATTSFTSTAFTDFDIYSADLLLTQFTDSTFTSSRISRGVWTKVDITRTSLGDTNAVGTSFPGGLWTKVNIAGTDFSSANMRGIKSSQITGKATLPKGVKVVSGVIQMAPAAPVFDGLTKSGSKYYLNWKEVQQTGTNATIQYRISTNNKTWGKWIGAKGVRTELWVNRYSTLKYVVAGLKAKKKYFVQAYLVNKNGKSATVKKSFLT
jgi:uncharacterized protein YjbI with pentapeptide repeats